MLAPSPNAFQWSFHNGSNAPASAPGTSVTPGASNAEGSATVLLTGSNMANDVYGMMLIVQGGSTSAAIKNHLLDIGIDPAGGTNYDWRVRDLGVGSSGTLISGAARAIWLPIFIPAGSQVACRIQGNNATAGTVTVFVRVYGRPTHPERVWAASYSENIGTISASCGPSVTPGTSGAEGSWTSIGTCSQRLRYLIPCLQMNDSATASQVIYMDLAVGSVSTNTVIMTNIILYLPGSAEVIGMLNPFAEEFWCDIPAGSEICVRLSSSIATAETCNVNLVGLG